MRWQKYGDERMNLAFGAFLCVNRINPLLGPPKKGTYQQVHVAPLACQLPLICWQVR